MKIEGRSYFYGMKTTEEILAEGTLMGSLEGTEWVDFTMRIVVSAFEKPVHIYLTMPSHPLRSRYPALETWMHHLLTLPETARHQAQETLWTYYCTAHDLDDPYDAENPALQAAWEQCTLTINAEAEDLENAVVRVGMDCDWWDLGVEVEV